MTARFRNSVIMKRFLSAMTAAVLIFAFLGGLYRQVNAQGSVVLFLSSSEGVVNSGDIFTLNIVADNFPHLTRFNDIEIEYEPDKVEFVSIGQPQELSGFIFSCDDLGEGTLYLSGVDEQTEEDLEEFRNTGDESLDISYYSEQESVIASLSFRVSSTVSGDISFRISAASGLIDSSGEEVEILINEEYILNVTPSVSGDSTLAYLSVGGATIAPEFSQSVNEYTCSVSRDTTELVITATPSNLYASVEVFGANDLELGENLVTVNVRSQDGSSMTEYKIYVTRQENYIPEGSGLVDNEGRSYTFLNFPQDVTIPDGFSQVTRIINGYTVPVYAIDGIPNILVYLYDGTNEPGLYFYNPLNHDITPYDFVNTIIKPGKVLTITDYPEDQKLPEGLWPTVIDRGGNPINGFVNADHDLICYMVDEDGVGGFYIYDSEESTFHEYKLTSGTGTQIYRGLFIFFMLVSILESIIIVVVVYIVRKVVIDRSNPRPKRV